MPTIVISKKDEVAVRVGEMLLGKFKESGKEFQGYPVYEYKGTDMIVIDGLHLYADFLDSKYPSDLYIFPSVHKSEKGVPSITVHPVGNLGDAMYGGKARELTPAPALNMLRALKSIDPPEGYSLSYEVTHHGPLLNNPAFFIEIGSSPREWKDEKALECVFKCVLEAVKGENAKVAIGIGGGHYAPKFTKIALKKNVAFGHMASKYVDLDKELVEKMVKRTVPDAKYYVIHDHEGKKQIVDLLEGLGLSELNF